MINLVLIQEKGTSSHRARVRFTVPVCRQVSALSLSIDGPLSFGENINILENHLAVAKKREKTEKKIHISKKFIIVMIFRVY